MATNLRAAPSRAVSDSAGDIQAYYREDEISLIDLWLVLVRRKRLVLALFLATAALGLAYLPFVPKQYKYYTAIEIGTTLADSGSGAATRLIDAPDTVLAKLHESYIPQVQREYMLQHPQDEGGYAMKARIPKGSEIVVVEADSALADDPVLLGQMSRVLEKLVADHNRAASVARGRLEGDLAREQALLDELEDPITVQSKVKELEVWLTQEQVRLEELRDPRTLALARQGIEAELAREQQGLATRKDEADALNGQVRRLGEVDALLARQIEELETRIKTSQERRQLAVRSATDPGGAMAVLLIDNEIQRDRERLASLEERRYVTQSNEREALENKIAENRRAQELRGAAIEKTRGELQKLVLDNERARERQEPEIARIQEQIKKIVADNGRAITRQRQAINEIRIKLDNMRETRAMVGPARSQEPAQSRKRLIAVLALVGGLFLAVFGAFFAEFLAKARERLAGG